VVIFTSNSGDQVSKIPLTQTRIIANILAKDLKLVPFTKYVTWYEKQQVCTRFSQYLFFFSF